MDGLIWPSLCPAAFIRLPSVVEILFLLGNGEHVEKYLGSGVISLVAPSLVFNSEEKVYLKH